MTWSCQYCKMKFPMVERCVYHEMYFCESNPKFIHRQESKRHDPEFYHDYLNKYIFTKKNMKSYNDFMNHFKFI